MGVYEDKRGGFRAALFVWGDALEVFLDAR
jgi:hypothetical protein